MTTPGDTRGEGKNARSVAAGNIRNQVFPRGWLLNICRLLLDLFLHAPYSKINKSFKGVHYEGIQNEGMQNFNLLICRHKHLLFNLISCFPVPELLFSANNKECRIRGG